MCFFIDVHVHADMIFLNLNDAPEEIENCRAGLNANNAKTGRRNKLEVVNGLMGARDNDDGRTNTYYKLRETIRSMLTQGRKIDSIVISGEDGSGHFFGTNGDFHQNELRDLINEFPELRRTLKSSALWGCYTSTSFAAEQFWLNRMPGMRFTMGFVTRGPEKSRPANHLLLKQFCERHEEAARLSGKDQLCDFYRSLQQLTKTSVGVCNREAIASNAYADANGEICWTKEEIDARCGEFTKNEKLEKTYQDYLSGRKTPEDEVGNKLTPLRKYYDEYNKFRQCREQFKADRGHDIPFGPEIIALIKYNKIRENLATLNAKELASYDHALRRAGLSDLAVGDLADRSQDRGMLNKKLEDAIRATRGPGKLVLHRMAKCMYMTFVKMDYRCHQFKNINLRMGDPSSCLMTYERAQNREDDDEC
jgi:hypothetical protein